MTNLGMFRTPGNNRLVNIKNQRK